VRPGLCTMNSTYSGHLHNEIVITIFFTFPFEFFDVKDKKKTYKGDNTKNIIRDSNLHITHL